MEDVIKTLIRQVIFKEGNTFDLLSAAMHRYTSESVHSLQEMKAKQTTKAKGDLFEAFCKVYLRTKYEEVWSLKDLPEDIRESLLLTRHDMGIDLIVKEKNKYSAVQCKWKSPYAKGVVPGTSKLRREKVNWSELCTFLVLCERSGPWAQHIVMTNGTGIRRVGRSSKKDKSICLKTFQGIPKETWTQMAGMEGRTLNETIEEEEDILSLQEKRLHYFTNKKN